MMAQQQRFAVSEGIRPRRQAFGHRPRHCAFSRERRDNNRKLQPPASQPVWVCHTYDPSRNAASNRLSCR